MLKKKALLFLSFFLIICQASFAAIKNPIQSVFNKPDVTTEGLEITALDFDKIEGILRLKVNNLNSISIDYPQISWTLKLGEILYKTETMPDDGKIGPNKVEEIQIPVSIPYQELYEKHPSLLRLDIIPYTVTADLSFKLPIFGKSSNSVVATGELPLLKKPVVSLDSILLNSMEPEQVVFAVTASLQNRNGFDIQIERVDYTLIINNTKWATGNTRRQILARPAQKSDIPLNIALRTSSMVSEAYALVLSEQDVRFDFKGTLYCKSSSPYLKNFELPFQLIGKKRIKL
ncbi:MAG: LEA type 2 family protein [Spirochaetia bacterium]|nr:LEA type 2 family protein [Spirochaetia bacterium]MBQ3647915.1 LEA type 2 family protein [Spirochaetia bacterium]MBQ3712906.1 LEA type 2 family protein [Spirochaetia bacterium]MBQ6673942.1 LEA type 2 family protein [Spirochaetia bacterium]MBQ6904727.1 LEA type 2 family protein [Spirochaetia bacterium]